MIIENKLDEREKSSVESAGYIGGTLTGAAQMVMPVRMWITLLASVALMLFVFRCESVLHIVRGFCVYTALISVLIGSAVFGRRLR